MLGLNSVLNAPSINVLPAQRSLLFIDSKYRSRNFQSEEEGGELIQVETNDQSPYDFQSRLSAAVVGKELIYQKLYWSQPLYCHNNDSCELRFQINGDSSTTFVVYALPFMMYTEYDGNNPFIPWGVPKVNSYASMMEMGFNGDVRMLNSNLQLINSNTPGKQPGYLYDANGFLMTIYFRYSPSQGFSISFGPSVNPLIPVYTIRLLPSSYFQNGHYVHGFGIFTPSFNINSVGFYAPRDQWTVAYFSDNTPNLIPFRYVVIVSNELTKDRRMASFQNTNSNRFNNELAIIALSASYTGTYHIQNIGDDATVISKRDDYQPQLIRISMLNELGFPIQCDSPISNLLQTPDIVNDTVKNSFLFGPQQGRGNVIFINNLVFGVKSNDIESQPVNQLVSLPQSTVNSPFGCINYTDISTVLIGPTVGVQRISSTHFWTFYNSGQVSQLNFSRQCIPIIVNPGPNSVQFPAFPDSYEYAGLDSTVNVENPFSLFGVTSNNPIPPIVSVFRWDPSKNSNVSIYIDAHLYALGLVAGGDPSQFQKVYVYVVGYSYLLNDFILASNALSTTLSFFPSLSAIDIYSNARIPLFKNPTYAGVTDIMDIAFYFTFQNSIAYPSGPLPPGTVGFAKVGMDFNTAIPVATPIIQFLDGNIVKSQLEYLPPNTLIDDDKGYEFGNPLAIAKCEDLIHEIVLVLDKN